MRVTGGRWASRRLHGPGRLSGVRPTPDAMRERVFAILGERCDNADFLDLFSGTGAVALEALSRGAAGAVAIEKDRRVASVLERNAEVMLGQELVQLEIWRSDWRRALRGLSGRQRRFDLVWADPPFACWREGVAAIERAVDLDLLKVPATVCLECPENEALDGLILHGSGLTLERDVRGGASRVVIFGSPSPQAPAAEGR